MMITTIHNADCLEWLRDNDVAPTCIFADPPDNIGLGYDEHDDRMGDVAYEALLFKWCFRFTGIAPIVWISFNAKWTPFMGYTARTLQAEGVTVKPCVQTFTFGQHNHNDLGNCHRPLWRFTRPDAVLYPDAIRVESWRQKNGDKRADPRGRVPGDVFDFPRVTGNSKQRRAWHPTQLHEGLVERCVLLSTKPDDLVLDPFAGTGTTLRVCQKLGRRCIGIEKSVDYCGRIAAEMSL